MEDSSRKATDDPDPDRKAPLSDLMSMPPELSPGTTLPEEGLRRWLGACGKGVRVYRGCRIIHPDRLRLGDYVQIDEGVIILTGGGVRLGNHVHLAFGSCIDGGGTCLLEDFVGLGSGVRLITGTELIEGAGLTNPTVPSTYRSVRRGRIEIGSHALIFTNSVVLPDVVIGEGAVVAAGSVVHRSLKPWGIYAGNPLVQVGVRPAERILQMARELTAAEAADSPSTA